MLQFQSAQPRRIEQRSKLARVLQLGNAPQRMLIFQQGSQMADEVTLDAGLRDAGWWGCGAFKTVARWTL